MSQPIDLTKVGGAIRGQLTLMDGSKLTSNEYGFDTLIRPYFGFTKEIYKLLPKVGVTYDKVLKTMLCASYDVTEGKGLTSTARVTFIGLADGKSPPPLITYGFSEQTTQLTTTLAAGDYFRGPIQIGPQIIYGQMAGDFYILQYGRVIGIYDPKTAIGEMTITYMAPTTTYVYVSRKKPLAPQFQGQVLNGNGLGLVVTGIRPANVKGRPVYKTDIRTTKWEVERVGPYFQVTEVSQAFLTSDKIATNLIQAQFPAPPPFNLNSYR